MERPDADEVRKFLIKEAEAHPRELARRAVEAFGISRQAVNRHLAALVKQGELVAEGTTRNRSYRLKSERLLKVFPFDAYRDEDKVWREFVAPNLGELPANVRGICNYGFTEIFNNAVDHSETDRAVVEVIRNPAYVTIHVLDEGVGIFRKIKDRFGLDDERHAILELAKGKLTTDPSRHSGEGISFSSRMFDEFSILSGRLFFGSEAGEDWLADQPRDVKGTLVEMTIARDSKRTAQEVFDTYADPESDDYGFSRTEVPVYLARYGEEELLSRSQARRVMARVDRFKVVTLDFENVPSIGQAFADEIFRVYVREHPDVEVRFINVSEQVRRMIARARLLGGEERGSTQGEGN